MPAKSPVAIFIDPPTHHFEEDRLFDSGTVLFGGDDILAPYKMIRRYFAERDIAVHTADFLGPETAAEKNIYISLGTLSRYAAMARRQDVVLSGFFAMECPIVEPSLYRALPQVQESFRRVFSWSDAGSLLRFTGKPVNFEFFRWPQCWDNVHEEIWSRTPRSKFLVMINANKLPRIYHEELYTKRLEAIHFFHQYGEIDVFGRHWERVPIRVGKPRVPYTVVKLIEKARQLKQNLFPNPVYASAAAASHGSTDSKSGTMGQYTFALCFENMVLNGWITEKIFDCFFVGTVPIYWGDPEIEKVIPPDCYIDMRHFKDFAALREHLHGLSDDDIEGYRQAGRRFLDSPEFRPFSSTSFLDIFRRLVREDSGLEV